uniref:C-type lectin domain-containing protein n=1 Tax=Cyprinus carpio carpio TaxID=630221 RepID=A0A8C1F8V9_CYPCA
CASGNTSSCCLTSSIPVPPPTSTPCSSGYITWYSSCYKLVSEPKTWEEAQQACVKEGGNLASVDMSYDQAFISAAVTQAVALLLQAGSDSYKWSDGWPVFFTHWGPGEPTNHEGEGCVSMHAPSHFIQGTWNDTACKSRSSPNLAENRFHAV